METIGKHEQESHIRIVDKAMNSIKLESIFEKGKFENPAVIIAFEKLPGKNFLNMLKNILSIESLPSEQDTFIYIGTLNNPSFVKVGKFNKSLDNIFRLQELLKAQSAKTVEITTDDKLLTLDYMNYITTMNI